MKNKFIFTLFASAALLIACNKSTDNTSRQKNVQNVSAAAIDTFEIFEYCDTFYLDTIGNNSPAMTIKISLPMLKGNSEKAKKINHYICCASVECEPGNSIEQNINNFVTLRKEDYYTLHSDYMNEKGINPLSPMFYRTYQIEGKMIESRKGTLCCEILTISYEGGAHGMECKGYVTLDEATGNCIGKSDIFAEYTNITLCDRLTASLARQLGVTTIEEIKEKGYLTDIDMWPTESFHITDDSIYFHYCPYEIAPYALGSTTIALGLDELKDIMK